MSVPLSKAVEVSHGLTGVQGCEPDTCQPTRAYLLRDGLHSGLPGDAHDPDQASEGGESSGDDLDDDEGEGAASSSSKKIVTSLNLDDVSSSEEEDEGNEEDKDADGEEGDETAATRGSGRGGKRVHWGGQEGEEREDEDGGGKRPRQQQANVFAGMAGEGVDAAASVEKQMMQLDEQDEKARRSGGGVAGQGELRRAREALR